MQLIKKQSKQTYKGKDGNEYHYYNYYLVVEGLNKSVQINASFKDDYKVLNAIAKYEK